MPEFKEAVELFSWGFLFGLFFRPGWELLKKVWAEAKKAKEEW